MELNFLIGVYIGVVRGMFGRNYLIGGVIVTLFEWWRGLNIKGKFNIQWIIYSYLLFIKVKIYI